MFACTYGWTYALLLDLLEPGFGRLARLRGITLVCLCATITQAVIVAASPTYKPLLLLPLVTLRNADPLQCLAPVAAGIAEGSPSLIA